MEQGNLGKQRKGQGLARLLRDLENAPTMGLWPTEALKWRKSMAMPVQLRDYQQEGVDSIRAALERNRAVLYPAPTGSGKSIIALALAKDRARVLFVTSRRTLIEQFLAQAEAFGISAIDATKWKAGKTWPEGVKMIVGSSVAIHRRMAHLHGKGSLPTLLVTDEAHHAAMPDRKKGQINLDAALVRRMTDRGVPVVGMTATPCRLEPDYGFDRVFSVLLEGPSYADLIEGKYLVGINVVVCSDNELIVAGRKRNGEFVESDIMEQNDDDKLYGNTLRTLAGHDFTRAIVFCVTQEHAYKTALLLQEQGLAVGLSVSSSEWHDRAAEHGIATGDAAVNGVREGTLSVLCGVGRFTEGFDLPEADAAIVLRPTNSFGLWRQIAGRLSRPHPNDPDRQPVLFDFAGNMNRHGQPDEDFGWSLLSQDNQFDERMRLAQIASEQDEAVREAQAQLTAVYRNELEAQKKAFERQLAEELAEQERHSDEWAESYQEDIRENQSTIAALRTELAKAKERLAQLDSIASAQTEDAWREQWAAKEELERTDEPSRPAVNCWYETVIDFASWVTTKKGHHAVTISFAGEGPFTNLAHYFNFNHPNDYSRKRAFNEWRKVKMILGQPFEEDAKPTGAEVRAIQGKRIQVFIKPNNDTRYPYNVARFKASELPEEPERTPAPPPSADDDYEVEVPF